MNILLAILRQICGDDCASQREDLADWAMFI